MMDFTYDATIFDRFWLKDSSKARKAFQCSGYSVCYYCGDWVSYREKPMMFETLLEKA